MNIRLKPEVAIEKAGSVMALARMLGVKRQAVQQWRIRGIPADRCIELFALRPEWFKSKGSQK